MNHRIFERKTQMNTEDMDYYEYEESKKRFTPKKIVTFIFKLIAFIIIAGTFALILGRIQLMKLPKSMKGLTWTDSIVEAFENGELDVILHTPRESYDSGVKINGKYVKGRYNISEVALSHSTNEVQFTFRYNSRSTINTLMELYGLTERPDGEVFVYRLRDGAGNTYSDYTFASASRPLYEFRRVIFGGVDLADVDILYLDVYYGEDVSTDGLMNYTLTLYNKEDGSIFPEYEKAESSKLTFTDAPAYISKLGN